MTPEEAFKLQMNIMMARLIVENRLLAGDELYPTMANIIKRMEALRRPNHKELMVEHIAQKIKEETLWN